LDKTFFGGEVDKTFFAGFAAALDKTGRVEKHPSGLLRSAPPPLRRASRANIYSFAENWRRFGDNWQNGEASSSEM